MFQQSAYGNAKGKVAWREGSDGIIYLTRKKKEHPVETPDAYLPKSVYKRNALDSKRVGICFRLLSKLNRSIHFHLAMFFILFSVLGKSLQMYQ